MFSCVKRPEDQKEVYFTINKLFSLDSSESKVRGIYVIFKDDICLYVGQSKNVASRLATHLSGKYQNADTVLIFVDEEDEDNLIPSEKYAIKLFKPIENVLADFSEIIDIKDLIGCFYHTEKGIPLFHTYKIILNEHNIYISNSESYNDYIGFEIMKHSINTDMEV